MKQTIESSWSKEYEENIYSSDFRDLLVDDGEMNGWEAAFMSGYDEAD